MSSAQWLVRSLGRFFRGEAMIQHSDESDDSSVDSVANVLDDGALEDGALGGGVAGPHDLTVDMTDIPSSFVPPPLMTIGEYEITKEIGRGGMGVVYEATQQSLQRKVALKVLPMAAKLDSTRAKRFENESRAAAQLSHPNIIPVYAVGTADGVSFFAMRLVEGKNLHQVVKAIRREIAERDTKTNSERALVSTQHDKHSTVNSEVVSDSPSPRRKSSQVPRSDLVDDARMELSAADFSTRSGRHSTTQRVAKTVARIGIRVADALQHAHDTGIVHRDIKPSNLMLDNAGKVWVTDFGLAHIRNSPSMTRTGDLLGTLRYMSPEQATGVRALMDHRTDIYSLGVTLCEVLTLHRVVQGESNEEVMRQVVYGAPTRVRKIDPNVPSDLATILEKAMSKNPLERYATAGEMAEDLHRFLHNESIKAKRPGVVKRCSQWLGRHKTIAATLAASLGIILVTSLVATGLVTYAWKAEAAQLERTQTALSLSESLRLLVNSSAVRNASPGLSLALAKAGAPLAPGLEANQTLLAAADVNHEFTMLEADQAIKQVTISTNGEWAITCAAPLKGTVAPAKLYSIRDGSELRTFGTGNTITSAAFSPNNQFVLTTEQSAAGETQPPALWDVNGDRLHTFSNSQLDQVHAGIFSPDSNQILLWQGNETATYDTHGKPLVVFRGHTDQVYYAEFSPDATRVVTISSDGTIRVWDSKTGKPIREPIPWTGEGRAAAHFTGNSNRLVVQDMQAIQLFAAAAVADENAVQVTLPRLFMEVSRRQNQAAFFGIHHVQIVSGDNLQSICEFDFEQETIRFARFHPTEKQLLVVCEKSMYLMDTETGQQLGEFHGHDASVTDAQLSSSSRFLASVSADSTLRLWNTESGYEQRAFDLLADEFTSPVTQLSATSADDQWVAAFPGRSFFSTVRRLNGQLEPCQLKGQLSAGRADCRHLVTIHGRVVTVTEVDTSREIYRGVFGGELTSWGTQLVDSQNLLVHTIDGPAILVDLASGARRQISEPGEAIRGVCVAADQKFFILHTGGLGRERYFAIDSATGNIKWDRRPDRRIVDLQLSPDAKHLAIVDSDSRVAVTTVENGESVSVIAADERPVNRVAFFGNGQSLITWHSRNNQFVRFYESLAAESHLDLAANGPVAVDVHPSQPWVVVGSSEQATLWNVEQNQPTSLIDRPCSSVRFADDHVALLLKRTESELPALQIRALESQELAYEEQLDLYPSKIDFDVNSQRWIVTEFGNAAHVFDYETSEFAYSSGAHPSPVLWAGFSSSLGRLATVSEDGLIQIVDDAGNVLQRANALGSPASTAAMDESGEVLLVGGNNGELVMWSVSDGSRIGSLDGHQAAIRAIRIDRSGNKAVSVAQGEPVRLWDLRKRTATEFAIENALHAEISSTGTHSLVLSGVEAGRGSTVWLIPHTAGQPIDVTQDPTGTLAAQFSPDGQRIGLLGASRVLKVMQLNDLPATECSVSTPRGTFRFAFSPDGERLLTATSHAYTLWSLPSCESNLVVANRRGARHNINQAWHPFSRDSQWFHTDAIPAKHPCEPLSYAESVSTRSLTPAERQRFHLNLIDAAKD
ncbi:MAG: protein kinase [Pirellulaceae bacterium]